VVGNASGGLLAVGGVRYNKDVSAIAALRGWDGKKLANLPSSEDEIADAEKALRPYMPIQALTHTDATETAFKNAQLSERRVIHLAVHGEASPETSDRAALFFLDDPNAREDGILELPEIVRLPLRAELVVLSACETAVGPDQGEDGVLGLHRAFLLAGARSVMATLWRIDDTFSEKLIRQFYAGIARGMTTSDALASAQRQFATDSVPYYWAGFIVDGADARIVSPQSAGVRQPN
jgi:CHAT domain-containing protein